MARKIVITSGKGGVGKTTICANLGVALARLNQRVVLVDVDIGLNNLDVVTGIENKIVYDIVDVIENKCRIKQALVQDLNYPNLYILPSAHSYNKSQVTAENVKKVIDNLNDVFDFVLIDCPAGIDEPFKRAVCGADEAIVVVTPHLSSLRDADKVLMMLTGFNLDSVSLVVNRVRGDMILDKEMLDSNKIAEILNERGVSNIAIQKYIPHFEDAAHKTDSASREQFFNDGAMREKINSMFQSVTWRE